MGIVGNEALQKTILLALQSAYVKNNEHPISLLIIADAEHGKTQTLASNINELIKGKRVFYSNNITAKYIEKNLLNDIKSGTLRHLILPDLINALERGKATRKLFVNFMKSLIEEGIVNVADAYGSFQSDFPVKCGMITGVTNAVFKQHQREWLATGFMSRLVPFSYSYDKMKIVQILDSIFDVKKLKENDFKIKYVDTEIIDAPKSEYANLQAIALSYGTKTQSIGIRMMKNLQYLCRASAMLHGRKKVTRTDINEVFELTKWINLDFNAL